MCPELREQERVLRLAGQVLILGTWRLFQLEKQEQGDGDLEGVGVGPGCALQRPLGLLMDWEWGEHRRAARNEAKGFSRCLDVSQVSPAGKSPESPVKAWAEGRTQNWYLDWHG